MNHCIESVSLCILMHWPSIHVAAVMYPYACGVDRCVSTWNSYPSHILRWPSSTSIELCEKLAMKIVHSILLLPVLPLTTYTTPPGWALGPKSAWNWLALVFTSWCQSWWLPIPPCMPWHFSQCPSHFWRALVWMSLICVLMTPSNFLFNRSRYQVRPASSPFNMGGKVRSAKLLPLPQAEEGAGWPCFVWTWEFFSSTTKLVLHSL
jgi:hypothetical protein